MSAVAARKAALAAQSGQTPGPLVPSGSGTSSPPLPKNGGSKRKPSSQKAHTATKKSRKLKPFEKSNPRPVNVFKEQVDMVVVDSEGEESESAMSVLDNSEQEPISQPKQEITGETGVVAQPSYRLIGRSEDDSGQGDVASSTPLDLSSLFPHLHRRQEEQSDEGRTGHLEYRRNSLPSWILHADGSPWLCRCLWHNPVYIAYRLSDLCPTFLAPSYHQTIK